MCVCAYAHVCWGGCSVGEFPAESAAHTKTLKHGGINCSLAGSGLYMTYALPWFMHNV